MSVLIPREVAGRFRSAARKCLSNRKGPDPPVLVEVGDGQLTLYAWLDEVGLALTVPASPGRDDQAVVPLSSLEAKDPLGLAVRAGPDRLPTEAAGLVIPDLPDTTADLPEHFLSALHEAGRTAAREAGKFAVRRVQVRGNAGQLSATDGRQALVQGGFDFPFGEDLLVPAVPVFGLKDVAEQAEVQVGRTDEHLVVTAGPWAVWLTIDAYGKFPDVLAAVPRSRAPTTLELTEQDALELLDALDHLPGGDEEFAPVTLHMGASPQVCGQAEEAANPTCVRLAGAVAGPAMDVALNRTFLNRALRLGFRKYRFVAPDRPWVAADDSRTYLAITLDPGRVAGSRPQTNQADYPQPPKEDTPMPPNPNGNGHPAADHGPDQPDLVELAEALRLALADAHAKAGRLVTALRGFRKQQRTVSSALASLRSLRLD